MQGLILAIVLLTAVNVSAQYWGEPWENFSQWIDIEDARPGEYGNMDYDVMGGVQYGELAALGLPNIAYHTQEGNGYYLFSGEYLLLGTPPNQYYDYEMMFPPGILQESDMTMPNEFKYLASYCYDCACGELAEYDTMYMAHGFGFWYDDPNYYCIWGIDHGYCVREAHQFPYHRRVCPPSQPIEKYDIHFSDSLYTYNLPDTAILTGMTSLYIRAYSFYDYDTMYAKLHLENDPENYVMVPLLPRGSNIYGGKGPTAVGLGLESFDAAKIFLYAESEPPVSTSSLAESIINCAFPDLEIYAFADTIYIRTDSMKIRDSLVVGLRIYSDDDGDELMSTECIEIAGYKYKSKWVANENLDKPEMHEPYYRQYPRTGDTLWWDGNSMHNSVTFPRDSLYVIGGDLKIQCLAKAHPWLDIKNEAYLTTDSIAPSGDSIAMLWIRVDQDPSKSLFKNYLANDRARAIAWEEYGGSADRDHCHEGGNFNPRWNNYWDTFIETDGDTCYDTRTPCENAVGEDTGIMQIYRDTWESTFDSSAHQGEYPQTFIVCGWDSLAWNWWINIDNGVWIFEEAMPHKMRREQLIWPESCSYANCDSVPDQPNREDLSNYGYHAGETDMRAIYTTALWEKKINNPKTTEDIEQANYIKRVRRYKYRGNLW